MPLQGRCAPKISRAAARATVVSKEVPHWSRCASRAGPAQSRTAAPGQSRRLPASLRGLRFGHAGLLLSTVTPHRHSISRISGGQVS